MINEKTPLLSICIPAYNGGKYLIECLDSIFPQVKHSQVEVVVVDDVSKDDSFELLIQYKKRHPFSLFKLIRNKNNLGFDRNVLEVISQGSGKFSWLLGQDDKLLPGSIKTITHEIKTHPDAVLIHCNYVRYDNLLKKVTSKAMIAIKDNLVFNDFNKFFFYPLKDPSYFKYLGTNVITMSTNIVNRYAWSIASKQARVGIGHNFIHCFVITKMIRNNPKIIYLGKPQVWYRAKNERVWPNDIWKEYNNMLLDYLIDLGYERKNVMKMRSGQRVYEKKELVLKSKVLGRILRFPPSAKAVSYARVFINKWIGKDI